MMISEFATKAGDLKIPAIWSAQAVFGPEPAPASQPVTKYKNL
jgi:hypothetical protein